jgi:hypothetical protein
MNAVWGCVGYADLQIHSVERKFLVMLNVACLGKFALMHIAIEFFISSLL